jgi:hypothetical protein
MKNRVALRLALCGCCILGLTSMVSIGRPLAQRAASPPTTQTAASVSSEDSGLPLRILDPALSNLSLQQRDPRKGPKEPECQAKNPKAVNTKKKP